MWKVSRTGERERNDGGRDVKDGWSVGWIERWKGRYGGWVESEDG